MTTNEARLVVEAALVTIAFIGLVGVASWYVVQSRRRAPNTYSEMENTLADMLRSQNEMRVQQAADHLAMRQMAMQITRLEIGVLKLSEQVRQLGGVPVYVPEPSSEAAPVIDDRTLAAAIAALFNDDELTALADEMEVPDGTLAGGTVPRRARELVEYMRRRNRLGELVATARRLRPDGGI